MTKTSRPMGRFFSVLISVVVMLVSAKAAFAGGVVSGPPPAPPAAAWGLKPPKNLAIDGAAKAAPLQNAAISTVDAKAAPFQKAAISIADAKAAPLRQSVAGRSAAKAMPLQNAAISIVDAKGAPLQNAGISIADAKAMPPPEGVAGSRIEAARFLDGAAGGETGVARAAQLHAPTMWDRSSFLARMGRPIAMFDGASGPPLTQINDIVYRADGTAAQGSVTLVWPGFTTAAGQTVAAGEVTVTLAQGGTFTASLAANTGSSPATYYRAVYHLNDGTTVTEFWVVPATQSTTISAVRSKLAPTEVAAQFLTRDVADSAYIHAGGMQTVNSVLTFASSPAVPSPQNPTDAANKAYVDTQVATATTTGAVKTAPSGSQSIVQPSGTALSVNYAAVQKLNNVRYADQFSGADAAARINAAIADLPASGGTVDARGFEGAQNFGAAVVVNKPVSLLLGGVTISNAAFVVSADFSLHSSNRAAAKLVAGPGATIFRLSGTVQQFEVEGFTLTGNGSGSQLYVAPDYQSGVNNFSGGRFSFDSDVVQYFGAPGVPAISLGVSNYMVSVTRSVFQYNYGCVLAKDMSELVFYDNNVWYQQDGPCLNLAGRARVFYNDFELNSYPSTQPDILVNATENGGDGIEWIANNSFGPEGDSTVRRKLVVNSAGGFEALRLDVQQNNFHGNNATAAIEIDTPVMNCDFSGNYFSGWNTLVADNQTAMAGSFQDQGRCQWGDNNVLPLIDAQGNEHATTTFANGGRSFSRIRSDGRSETEPIVGYVVRSEWPSLVNRLYASETLNSWATNVLNGAFTVTGGQSDPDGGSSAWLVGRPGNSANEFIDSAIDGTVTTLPGRVSLGLWAKAGTCSSFTAGIYDSTVGSFVGVLTPFSLPASGWKDYTMTYTGLTPGHAYSLYLYPCGVQQQAGTIVLYHPKITDLENQPYVQSAASRGVYQPGLGMHYTKGVDVGGDLTLRDIPGAQYMVSKYGSLQAAINAAYNNGAVLGMVIDDRTAPYAGPGFILYDSVALKLAPTTYTITSTVSYNNGNNTVTAGIISVPGSRLIGSSTSTNHGTVLTAGNGLNADLIATSTVGTGIGSTAQWWHWGGLEDLRVEGNGANQTAGNCINVENMGETAFLRSIEVSGCKLDNILFTGASATPSDIRNITTNIAGRYGINFNNLAGMAVVHGLSGDSNTTSLIRLNGGQSGTLTILGLKTEEELSGQDPLITIDQTGQSTSQPGLYVVGGYTFGRTGVNDIIKVVNGSAGSTPFINFSNFYTQNYVNAVNDTVNGRTVPAASMSKVPFYYGPTGGFLSGQAYTLDLNTFIQGAHSGNGLLTEIFGNSSSNETLVAAAGNSTSLSTGGIGFRMPNRTTFGATPELMAKMTFAFPGGVVNNQQWEFIPAKVNSDTSTRWIGDPSYRWDEVYAADVNTTTATIGTLSVTNCTGCTAPPGTHLLNYQTNTATLVGNGSDQTVYSYTLPGGTLTAATGVQCYLKAQRVSGTGAITYKWKFGATTAAYGALSSGSASISTEMEVFDNLTSTTAQILNVGELHLGNAISAGALYNYAPTENSANPVGISVTFNGASTEQIKGITFKCMAEQ